MTDKDANELIDEVAAEPELSAHILLRDKPDPINWPKNGPDLVDALRADRARFIAKNAERKEKKEQDDE